jgi:hypothetical protein
LRIDDVGNESAPRATQEGEEWLSYALQEDGLQA